MIYTKIYWAEKKLQKAKEEYLNACMEWARGHIPYETVEAYDDQLSYAEGILDSLFA